MTGAALGAAALLLLAAPKGAAGVSRQPIVLNDDGGWCWFQDERAIVVGGRLVLGTVAAGRSDPERRGVVEATVVDLETGEATRVALSVSPLPPAGSYDDHNAPAFVVRGDRRLLAVYAAHGADALFRYRVSARPGDPREWGPERLFTPSESSRVTYSNLHRLSEAGGRIYNFYRGLDDLFKPSLAWSDDSGETWSSGGVVIDVPTEIRHRPYVKYASDGRDAIHLAYTEGHPRDFDNSVFHVVLRGDGRLLGSDGSPVGRLPGGLSAPQIGTRVFEGGPDRVAWVADMELDASGRPFVAYSVQQSSAGLPRGAGGADHRYRLARWDGARWLDEELGFAGTRLYAGEDDYTGGVALVPGAPDLVVVSTNADPATGRPLVSAGDGRRHWEIFLGERTPGAGLEPPWRWTALTRDSTHDNLRPVVPRSGSGEPVVVWLRGAYRSYTDYDLEVVAHLP